MKIVAGLTLLAAFLAACSGSPSSETDTGDSGSRPIADLNTTEGAGDLGGQPAEVFDAAPLLDVADAEVPSDVEHADEDVSAEVAPEVDACTPNCEDKQCGEDGCGGICGECTGEQDECIEGGCVCVPACEAKQCGDDGCGAACGECDGVDKCIDGTCVSPPFLEEVIIVAGDSSVGIRNVVADQSGHVYFAGVFWGNYVKVGDVNLPVEEAQRGLFVIGFKPEGGVGWFRPTGASYSNFATHDSVAIGPAGGVLVADQFKPTDQIDLGGEPIPSATGEDIFVASYAPDGSHIWSTGFAGSGADVREAMASSPSGELYLSGDFYWGVDFGNGPVEVPAGYMENAFVVKLGTDGVPVWSKTVISFQQSERGLSVSVGADGSVFWGVSANADTVNLGGDDLHKLGINDLAAGVFDPDGEHVWSKRFGVPGEHGFTYGVKSAVTPDGSVLLSGGVRSEIDFGGGPLEEDPSKPWSSCLVQLDALGEHVWSKRLANFPQPSGEPDEPKLRVWSMVIGTDGSIFFGGRVHGELDLGGGPMGTPDGKGGVVAKFDSSGNHIWSFYTSEEVTGVDLGPGDTVYAVTGFYSDEIQLGGETFTNQADGVDPNSGEPWGNAVLFKLSQ